MGKDEVQQLLPKVGDIRMEIPTVQDAVESAGPKKCVVTEVEEKRFKKRRGDVT